MNLRTPGISPTGGWRVTGRMVFFTLVGFFGLILVANIALVDFAISTFGGVDTPSSYQAGLHFKDEEAAADVTQEALLLAHRHRDSFRGDAQFSTWLYRVAATTSLMWLRRQRRIGREVPMPMRVTAPSTLKSASCKRRAPSPRRSSAPSTRGASPLARGR